MKKIHFILFTLLLGQIIYSQDIDYMKMIEMEIGSSLNDVKNIWDTSKLNEYGYLKGETIVPREKTSYLKYGDKSEEYIFSCRYSFVEDSLFSITIIPRLTLEEANVFVNSLEDKYGKLKQDFDLELQSFDVEKINRKDSSTNRVAFGVARSNEKIKTSFDISNLRLVEKRKTIIKEFISNNDSLDGFFDIEWGSTKEEVIEKMKSFNNVNIESLNEYRVDFIDGEFGGVKVSKWIFAFEDDKFYNLLIEFDSQVGNDDFDQVKEFLISNYGNEVIINTVYHSTKNKFLKFFNWLYYYNSIDIFAKVNLKGCCDVERPKPLRLSYTYVPISRTVLPKRPPNTRIFPIK